MALEPVKDSLPKTPEDQPIFHQLEIPGMEEFLTTPKTKQKNTRKSKSQ